MRIDVDVGRTLSADLRALLDEDTVEDIVAGAVGEMDRDGTGRLLRSTVQKKVPVVTGQMRDKTRRGRVWGRTRGGKATLHAKVPPGVSYADEVLWQLDGGRRGRVVWRAMAREFLVRAQRAVDRAAKRVLERRSRRSGLPF